MILAVIAGLYAVAQITEKNNQKWLEKEFNDLLTAINTCKSLDDVNLLYPRHMQYSIRAGGNKDPRCYHLQEELLLKRAEMLKKEGLAYPGDTGPMMGKAY